MRTPKFLRPQPGAFRRGGAYGLAILLAVPTTMAMAEGEGSAELASVDFRAEAGSSDLNAGRAELIPAQNYAVTAAKVVPDAGLVEAGDAKSAADEGVIARMLDTGVASWYGPRFAGKPTASGERFDPTEMTAAHRTLPFGSRVRVTSQRTGKSVIVRINDRGPFHGNRVIDLSEAAAKLIGLKGRGSGKVEMALLAR